MFTVRQIVSATTLQRNFNRIAKQIDLQPQAFLITREREKHLVLVDAEIFHDLMEYRYVKSVGLEQMNRESQIPAESDSDAQ